MDMSIMGEKIKAARMAKKYTLEKLSERIGISRNFLWEIEAGRKAPAIQTLYNISKELNLSIDYMFGLSENKKLLDNADINTDTSISRLLTDLSEKEIMLFSELLKTYITHK